MVYNIGDNVRLVATPAQVGVVLRISPLKVTNSIVLIWDAGPIYSQDKMMAYFCNDLDTKIELVP